MTIFEAVQRIVGLWSPKLADEEPPETQAEPEPRPHHKERFLKPSADAKPFLFTRSAEPTVRVESSVPAPRIRGRMSRRPFTRADVDRFLMGTDNAPEWHRARRRRGLRTGKH
jgi:hypothetical protein